jgi:hypothetical protein
MMKTQTTVESTLFRSYWDDGLLDLLCGVGLLGIGIGFATDHFVFSAVMPALLTVLWRPLRARVVEPRSGYVRFTRSRRSRTTRELRLTAALGTAVLFLAVTVSFILRSRGTTPVAVLLVPGLPAALVAVGFSLGGWLTGARRFHWYAVALVGAALVTIVFGGSPGPPLVAVGLLVVATGAILLSRFLKDSREFQHMEGS